MTEAEFNDVVELFQIDASRPPVKIARIFLVPSAMIEYEASLLDEPQPVDQEDGAKKEDADKKESKSLLGVCKKFKIPYSSVVGAMRSIELKYYRYREIRDRIWTEATAAAAKAQP